MVETSAANAGLSVGDEVHTVFYLGEGHYKARKGDIWVTWEQDAVKLRELVAPRYEEWYEVLVGSVRGFSNVAPFDTLCV